MDVTMPKVAAISEDAAGGTPAGGTAAVAAMQTAGAGQTMEGFPIKQGGPPWGAIAAGLLLAAGAGWYFLAGPGAADASKDAAPVAAKSKAPEVEAGKPAAQAPVVDDEKKKAAEAAAAKQAALEAQVKRLAAEQAAQSAKPKMAKLVLSSPERRDGSSWGLPVVYDSMRYGGARWRAKRTLMLKLDGYKEYPLKVSLVHGDRRSGAEPDEGAESQPQQEAVAGESEPLRLLLRPLGSALSPGCEARACAEEARLAQSAWLP